MSKDVKVRSISFEDCLDELIISKKDELGLSVTAYVKACVMADLFPELRLDPSAKLSHDEIKMLNTYATQNFNEEYKEFIYFRMAKAKGLHINQEQKEQEQSSTVQTPSDSAEPENHIEEHAKADEKTLDVPQWVSSSNNTNDTTNNDNNVDSVNGSDSKNDTNANTETNTKVDTKVDTKPKTNANAKKKPKKPFKMDDMSFEGTCI